MADLPSLAYPVILAHAKRILLSGTATEIRLLRRGPALAGYFSDPIRMADDIVNHDGPSVLGSYFVSGPVPVEFLARIDNHLRPVTKEEKLNAGDLDILFRTNITFDLDPVRAAGISSTDIEHDRALLKAHDIAVTMNEWYGWPDPDIIDSGNGAHVRWWVRMENTPENAALVQACLHKAASIFNDQYTEVDTSGFNASRLWRFPGTIARKGEHMADRPWRTSGYVSKSGPLDALTASQLLAFVGKPPAALLTPSQPQNGGIQLPPDNRYRSLNRKALDRLDDWVPAMFPAAYRSTHGWRVTSKALDRDRMEDLSFTPKGIKDFGEHDMDDPLEGKRSPVMVVAAFITGGNGTAAAALLAETLSVTTSGFTPLMPPPSEQPAMAPLMDPNAMLGVSGPFSLEDKHIDAFLTNPLKIVTGPPPLAIYDGWVHEGIVTFFNALQKTGKSTLMWQIGLCALKGLPIFRNLMPCRRKVDWLLIYAFEDHRSNISRKMQLQYRAICREHDIRYSDEEYHSINDRIALVMPNSPEFRKAVLDGSMPDLRGGDWADSIAVLTERLKQRHGPNGLIVIDTFQKMTGYLDPSSNSITDMDMIKTDLLMHKAADLKVPMLVTHHLTKGAGRNDGANAESFIHGTFAFAANVDSYITMTKPSDKDRQMGVTDVKMHLQGRMDDLDGSWGELPSLISYSPKVKRIEDGGFIFRAKVMMPQDPSALDPDQERVYAVFLSKLSQYLSINKLEALTALSNRRINRAVIGLVEKDKIIEIQINAREVGYCIMNSIGHMEAEKRAGIVRGDMPAFRMPNVL